MAQTFIEKFTNSSSRKFKRNERLKDIGNGFTCARTLDVKNVFNMQILY